ncbi:hypothetical protein G7Y89_g15172 [Cudoniella acicularis]|uniref:Uncharacterized protein n=1 Tax=Cudoniella acicularis TaxID=354080 RepID=A0A8H4QRT0_9HELO|nr:hypothetical protein G7Y89_g15172 [Cudoniella acicularis]
MLILLSSTTLTELVGALFTATEETKLAKYSTNEALCTLKKGRVFCVVADDDVEDGTVVRSIWYPTTVEGKEEVPVSAEFVFGTVDDALSNGAACTSRLHCKQVVAASKAQVNKSTWVHWVVTCSCSQLVVANVQLISLRYSGSLGYSVIVALRREGVGIGAMVVIAAGGNSLDDVMVKSSGTCPRRVDKIAVVADPEAEVLAVSDAIDIEDVGFAPSQVALNANIAVIIKKIFIVARCANDLRKGMKE